MKHLLFFLSTICCFSQSQLKETQLKEDYEILKTIISEVSPALTEGDKNDLINYFNSHESELQDKEMSSIEFFRFLIELKANTKTDEHGSLTLSADVMKEILTQSNVLFPIPILIIDDKLVVNHEKLPLPYGSIIYEINDRKVGELLDEMLNRKDAFTLRNLEPSFDALYLIKYGSAETFKILYTPPNSRITETIWVEAIDVKSRETLYRNVIYPLGRESLSNLLNTKYFEEKDTYYVQLNSFNAKTDSDNFYKEFDDVFTELFKDIKKKDPKNVIIDLRYNGGGRMIIPALFYSYLATKPFNETIHLKIPDFQLPYKEYIKTIEGREVDDSAITQIIEDFKKPFTKIDDHYEHRFIDSFKMKPNKRAYTGNVYLLIGGKTFSAASHFTALFKSENRGKLVGEQLGGSHKTITAGLQVQYELPNSKLLLGMPLGVLEFSEAVTNIPGTKIEPDIPISEETKYRYFLQKEDWDLQEVLKLVD